MTGLDPKYYTVVSSFNEAAEHLATRKGAYALYVYSPETVALATELSAYSKPYNEKESSLSREEFLDKQPEQEKHLRDGLYSAVIQALPPEYEPGYTMVLTPRAFVPHIDRMFAAICTPIDTANTEVSAAGLQRASQFSSTSTIYAYETEWARSSNYNDPAWGSLAPFCPWPRGGVLIMVYDETGGPNLGVAHASPIGKQRPIIATTAGLKKPSV